MECGACVCMYACLSLCVSISPFLALHMSVCLYMVNLYYSSRTPKGMCIHTETLRSKPANPMGGE